MSEDDFQEDWDWEEEEEEEEEEEGDEDFQELLGRAYYGHTEEVLAAVDLDVGLVNRVAQDGNTLLLRASTDGRVNLIEGLLERKADIHARAAGGWNSVMHAAFNGHLPAITLLMNSGASMTTTSNGGRNALMWDAYRDSLSCALFLLSRGCDLRLVNNQGQSAVDLYDTLARRLDSEAKEQRRQILRDAFAKGPHPSQVQRRKGENYQRRRALLLVVVENGFRPLAARRLELEMARASLDPTAEAELPPVLLDTAEKRRAHYMGQVLTNDGLLRLVVSFL